MTGALFQPIVERITAATGDLRLVGPADQQAALATALVDLVHEMQRVIHDRDDMDAALNRDAIAERLTVLFGDLVVNKRGWAPAIHVYDHVTGGVWALGLGAIIDAVLEPIDGPQS